MQKPPFTAADETPLMSSCIMRSNTVFIIDDYILSTSNAEPLAKLPPERDLTHDTEPEILGQLNLASNRYLHLGFIPSMVRWDAGILQRFAFEYHTFPIEQDGVKFRLASGLGQKWYRIECVLRDIMKLLFRAALDAWFPLEVKDYPLPSKFGCLRSHAQKRWARKCAKNSKDAFLSLMALCSFAMSFHLPPDDWPIEADPPWVPILIKDGVIHPEWVKELKNSFIGDFSGLVQRVGVVVKVETCQWIGHLWRLRSAKVPVWLCWGRKHLLDSPPHQLAKFFPTAQQVNLPLPNNDSRQRYGETWQEFFAREAAHHAKMAERETTAETAARLQLQKQSEKFCCPDKATSVFRWFPVNGFRIRTRAPHMEVDSFWDDLPSKYKRFNAFDREWDICEEFDPKFGVEDDGFLDDGDGKDDGDCKDEPYVLLADTGPDVRRFPWKDNCPHIPEDMWRNDLLSIFGEGHSHRSERFPQVTQTLDQFLYERFGFDLMPDSTHDEPEPSAEEWWKDAVLLLQDPSSPVTNKAYKRPIIDFIRKLYTGAADTTEALSWDLSSPHVSFLRPELRRTVKIVKVKVDQLDDIIYVLDPILRDTRNVGWSLAVRSPSSALFRVRLLSHLSLNDVVRYLLNHGIPFHTLIPPWSPSALLHQESPFRNIPPPRPFVGLGSRYPGHKFDAADYAAYEAARESLFKQLHARAALQRGGIVWRLAVEYFDPPSVLIGPSEDALTRGLTVRSPSGRDYCDDLLTEAELDLICGVYHVHTGDGNTVAHGLSIQRGRSPSTMLDTGPS